MSRHRMVSFFSPLPLLLTTLVAAPLAAALNNNDGTLRGDIAAAVDTTGYTPMSCSLISSSATIGINASTYGRLLLFDGCSATDAAVTFFVDVDAWAGSGSQVDIVLRNPSLTGTMGSFVVKIGSFTSGRSQNCVSNSATGTGVRLRIEGGTVSGSGYVGVVDASWCGAWGDSSTVLVSGVTAEVVGASVTAVCPSTGQCVAAACSVAANGAASAIAVVASGASCTATLNSNGVPSSPSIAGAVAFVYGTNGNPASSASLALFNSVLAAVASSTVTAAGLAYTYAMVAGVGVAARATAVTVYATHVTLLLADSSSSTVNGGQYSAIASVGISLSGTTSGAFIDGFNAVLTNHSLSFVASNATCSATSVGVSLMSTASCTLSINNSNIASTINTSSTARAVGATYMALSSVGVAVYSNDNTGTPMSITNVSIQCRSGCATTASNSAGPLAIAAVGFAAYGTAALTVAVNNTSLLVDDFSNTSATGGSLSSISSAGLAVGCQTGACTLSASNASATVSANSSSVAYSTGTATPLGPVASVGIVAWADSISAALILSVAQSSLTLSQSTSLAFSAITTAVASVGVSASSANAQQGTSVAITNVLVAAVSGSNSTATTLTADVGAIASVGLVAQNWNYASGLTIAGAVAILDGGSSSSAAARAHGPVASVAAANFGTTLAVTTSVSSSKFIVSGGSSSTATGGIIGGQIWGVDTGGTDGAVVSVGIAVWSFSVAIPLSVADSYFLATGLSSSSATTYGWAATASVGIVTWSESGTSNTTVNVTNCSLVLNDRSSSYAAAQPHITTSTNQGAVASVGLVAFSCSGPVTTNVVSSAFIVANTSTSTAQATGLGTATESTAAASVGVIPYSCLSAATLAASFTTFIVYTHSTSTAIASGQSASVSIGAAIEAYNAVAATMTLLNVTFVATTYSNSTALLMTTGATAVSVGATLRSEGVSNMSLAFTTAVLDASSNSRVACVDPTSAAVTLASVGFAVLGSAGAALTSSFVKTSLSSFSTSTATIASAATSTWAQLVSVGLIAASLTASVALSANNVTISMSRSQSTAAMTSSAGYGIACSSSVAVMALSGVTSMSVTNLTVAATYNSYSNVYTLNAGYQVCAASVGLCHIGVGGTSTLTEVAVLLDRNASSIVTAPYGAIASAGFATWASTSAASTVTVTNFLISVTTMSSTSASSTFPASHNVDGLSDTGSFSAVASAGFASYTVASTVAISSSLTKFLLKGACSSMCNCSGLCACSSVSFASASYSGGAALDPTDHFAAVLQSSTSVALSSMQANYYGAAVASVGLVSLSYSGRSAYLVPTRVSLIVGVNSNSTAAAQKSGIATVGFAIFCNGASGTTVNVALTLNPVTAMVFQNSNSFASSGNYAGTAADSTLSSLANVGSAIRTYGASTITMETANVVFVVSGNSTAAISGPTPTLLRSSALALIGFAALADGCSSGVCNIINYFFNVSLSLTKSSTAFLDCVDLYSDNGAYAVLASAAYSTYTTVTPINFLNPGPPSFSIGVCDSSTVNVRFSSSSSAVGMMGSIPVPTGTGSTRTLVAASSVTTTGSMCFSGGSTDTVEIVNGSTVSCGGGTSQTGTSDPGGALYTAMCINVESVVAIQYAALGLVKVQSRTKTGRHVSLSKPHTASRSTSAPHSSSRSSSNRASQSKSTTVSDGTRTLTSEPSASKSLTLTLSRTRTLPPTKTKSATTARSSTRSLTGTFSASWLRSESKTVTQTWSITLSNSPTVTTSPTVTLTLTVTRTLKQRRRTRSNTAVLPGLTLLTAPVTPPTTSNGAKKTVMVPNFLLSAPFSTTYAVRRFMLSSSNSGLASSVTTSVIFSVSTASSSALVQLITSSSSFDYVTLGASRCENNFVGGPAWNNLSLSCGDSAWCYLPTFATSPGVLRLTGSPALAASTPSCNPLVFLFGSVAIDGTFNDRGVYSVISMTPGSTPGSSVTLRGSALPVTTTINSIPVAAASIATLQGPTAQDEASLAEQTPQQRCDYSDIRSFAANRGVGLGATLPCLVTLSGGGTRPCATLAEYHYQCAASADCVGYSTVFEGPNTTSVTTEFGLYLHTSTYGFTAESQLLSKLQSYSSTGATVAAVMYYGKPPVSSRTCSFRVTATGGGSTSVYLLQTTYSTASAIVYVTLPGSTVAIAKKQCGALQPFIRSSQSTVGKASYLATDGQCSTYALCYETGQLPSGSVISVVASHDLSPGVCNQSLSTLVNFTAAAPNATPSPLYRTYNASVNTSGMIERPLLVPLPSAAAVGADTLTIKVFWADVTSVALKVTQTAWDCSTVGCPASGVTITSPAAASPLGACGGLLDFHDGAAQSGQCGLLLDCLPSRVAVGAPFSTGIATITVNATLLRSYMPTFTVSSDCTGFKGTLFVSTGSASGTSPFALSLSSTGHVAPLLALKNGALAASQTLLPVTIATLRSLLTLGPYGEAYTVYSILGTHSNSSWSTDGETPFVTTQRSAFTTPNVTFACVADTLSSTTVTCQVPIPIGANWMRVRVMQSDFAANAITVSVLNGAGVALSPLTRTCGGSVNSRFTSTVGRTGACDVYSDCIKTYLSSYSGGSAVTGNASFDFVTLQLAVPNTVQPQGCDVALSALVSFAANAVDDMSKCHGFVCAADMKCISNASVCDGAIADCSDGADEATCGSFQKLEVGRVISTSALTPSWVAKTGFSSVTKCRWLCVYRGCMTFTLEGGVCSLYDATAATQFFAAPSQYLSSNTSDASAVVYGVLQYAAQYRHCSQWLLCNDGKGTIHNAAQLKDGDTCTCDCSAAYTGESCGTLKSIAEVGEYMMLVPRGVDYDIAALASAFAAGNSSIQVTIEPFRAYNSTVTAVPFALTSTNAAILAEFVAGITSPAYVAKVNAILDTLGLPHVLFPLLVDAVSATSTPSQCNVTTGLCDALPTVPVSSLTITTVGIQQPYRLRLNWAVPSDTYSARRGFVAEASSAGAANALCDSVNVVTTESATSCVIQTCVVSVNFTGQLTNVQLVAVSDDGVPPTLSGCANPTASLAASPRVDAATATSSTSSGQAIDPQVTIVIIVAFLQAGAALFGMLGIFAIVGFVAGYVWSRTLRRTRVSEGLRDRWRRAELPEWVRDLLTQMTHTSLLKRMNLKQVGITFSIFVVMSGGIGGAMMVLYQTEQTAVASFGILVSSFSSPVCGGDAVTTLPFQTGFVDALETQCQLMAVAGMSTGPQYAKAKCVRDSTGYGYVPSLVVAGTIEECTAAPLNTVPSGSCVALNAVAVAAYAEASGTVYLSALCLPVATGEKIFAEFQTVAPVPNATTVVDTMPASRGIADSSTTTQTYTAHPVAAEGNAPSQSTSSAANRISCMVSDATFWGPADNGGRVVVQPEDPPTESVFLPGAAAIANLTTPIEAEARPMLTSLPVPAWRSNQTPNDGDYPVGFVFNNFGTVDAARAADAYPGAHRYTGVSQTPFDIGTQYGPSASSELDGFTISAWLRASRSTEGFAFVLCDHFEDRTTRESHVVRKLTSIARDGATSNQAWFAKSFHVYGSLYVAGPSTSLMFLFADPDDGTATSLAASANTTLQRLLAVVGGTQTASGGTVQRAYWDLSAIGQEHVFNGAWHHISVVLQNVNSRPLARLIVDGVTSTAIGWQQCLDRRPQPVVSNRSTVVIPDNVDPNTVSVLDDGALYVGHFNGGVRGLQFDGTPLTPPSFIRTGTRAIKVRAAAPKATLNALAYAVLIVVVFIFVLSIKIIVDGAMDAKKEIKEEHEHLRADWNSHIEFLFPAAAGYTPMAFDVALTLLQDTPESVISQLVAYCVKQPLEVRADGRSLAVTAVRVLWLSHQQQHEHQERTKETSTLDAIRAVYPTPQQWSTLVREAEFTVPAVSRQIREKRGGKLIAAIRARSVALSSVMQNVLTACQSTLLYTTAFRLPRDFLHNFLPFLEVTGFDIFTPLQLSTVEKLVAFYTVATIALVVLAFVLSYDQRNYFQMALRYMVRRNRALKLLRRQTDTLETIVNAVDEDERRVACPYQYNVATLGRNVRARVYEFSKDADRPPTQLTDGEGVVFTLHHVADGAEVLDATTKESREATKEDVTFVLHSTHASPAAETPVPLMPMVGKTCPEHPNVTLRLHHQDAIKPYRGRYGCRATVAGQRCGRREGVLFVCNEAVDADLWRDRLSAKQRLAYLTIFGSHDKDDEEVAVNEAEHFHCTCNYALCEEHFAASTRTNLKMQLVAQLRELTGSGFGFIFARFVIFVAFALYTPIMQNSIMVVSCHTYFQCQFPHCWTKVDSSFGSAAYVALLAIVLVGVGFPALLLYLLYERERAVDDVFLDTRYDGRFMEVDADNCTAEEALAAVQPCFATRITNIIVGDSNPRRLVNNSFVPSSALTDVQRRQRAHTLRVQATVWADFFDNDKSLLAKTYEVLRKECMAYAPIMTLARFAILIPALATGSGLVQYALLAGGAAAYAMWLAITRPYRSRFVHLIDNAGITLQLGLIGWQAYYSARVNDTDTDDEQNAALTSTMACYFTVVTLITLTMIVRPIAADTFAVIRGKRFFTKLGLNDFSVVPVFLAPTKPEAIRRHTRDTDQVSDVTLLEDDASEESSGSSDGDIPIAVKKSALEHHDAQHRRISTNLHDVELEDHDAYAMWTLTAAVIDEAETAARCESDCAVLNIAETRLQGGSSSSATNPLVLEGCDDDFGEVEAREGTP